MDLTPRSLGLNQSTADPGSNGHLHTTPIRKQSEKLYSSHTVKIKWGINTIGRHRERMDS